jgi:signal transduction histidine kinase/AmiR/NasT family two-component response regulator
VVQKSQGSRTERRRWPRSTEPAALKGRTGLLVRIAAVLSVFAVLINIVAISMQANQLEVLSRILFAGLVVFLLMAFQHVWAMTNRQLVELQSALKDLRTARQHADEANNAKSRFLAAVSHELRTPMNGVIGMTNLLLDTKLSHEQRSYAEAVDMSGRSLLSIIDELLDAAKAESGEMTIVPAPFNLCELVEASVELLAARAHANSIEISCYIAPNLPDQVIGDAQRLRQIILNIAGNAIKFTQQGSVLVRVERGTRENQVAFSIADTGHGIPEAEHEAVFERFVQSSVTEIQASGGTGLGLAISRNLVELMDGKITFESEVGKGTTFRFDARLPSADEDTGASTAKALSGCTVFLVSPPGATRSALHDYLYGFGAQCISVGNFDGLAGTVASMKNASDGGRMMVILDPAAAKNRDHVLKTANELSEIVGVWALLKPEERRTYRKLMDDVRIGYLLKPTRRATLLEQLTATGDPMHKPVTSLRKTARQLRRVKDDAGLKVLLVEDNRINMLLATKMLKAAGHTVTHLDNGAKAVTEIKNQLKSNKSIEHDIILMDIFMPKIDGVQTTRQIRELEKEHGVPTRVPILALTANLREDSQRACLNAGMDGYLTKPFDRADLEEAVAGLMRTGDAA